MAVVAAEIERVGRRNDEREANDHGGRAGWANKSTGVRRHTTHQRHHDVLMGRGLHNKKEADGIWRGYKRRGRIVAPPYHIPYLVRDYVLKYGFRWQ